MKILVTGATGFIGRELIKKLQNSFVVIALVRDSSDTTKLEAIDCKVESFSEYDEIVDVFDRYKFAGVIHLASNILVEHKNSDINSLIDSNITFSTFLLEASKRTKVQWFINTGTFWQNYENKGYNPVNLYAATKEAFTTIAKFYTQTSDLIFTTIKLNDTFGPNDTRAKVFNLWTKIAASGEKLEMSAGEQIIDISYIDDVVSAYERLINLLEENAIEHKDKTYVVSNEERLSLKNLSLVFEKVTNSQLNIDWGGREYRDREVMIPYDLGVNVPGWKQKYTLEEAIRKTVKEI
ncbi:MAG: hypothetical protein COB67_07430 [SAR324 cluster bacterium]|uniref:NAD-dependent epimerase/dehydratase domain-containing protein n=1 Tax=SAR324 cluster bacterium TaxID=2024889 RepID=A0A2A4T4N1_9DELT|nr:MAG: hypothetical protein COB67_07430 [SAR324 cluster bacterium]